MWSEGRRKSKIVQMTLLKSFVENRCRGQRLSLEGNVETKESSKDVSQMACVFAVGTYLMKRGDDAEKGRRQGYEHVSLGSRKGWTRWPQVGAETVHPLSPRQG